MIVNKNSSDYELERAINKLKELYSIDPKRAKKEVNIFNDKLDIIVNSKQPEAVRKRNNIITLIILSLIIGLEGLLLIGTDDFKDRFFMYFFGYLFFVSGHHIGMNVKFMGIIFLFSHSVTGIGIMISSCIKDIITSPIMTDLSTNYKLYLYIALSLFIIATIYVIAYNLSDRVKNIKYSNYIPLLIYIIAFGMTIGFKYLVN